MWDERISSRKYLSHLRPEKTAMGDLAAPRPGGPMASRSAMAGALDGLYVVTEKQIASSSWAIDAMVEPRRR